MRERRLANLLGAAAVAIGDRIDEQLREVAGLEGEAPAAVLTVGTRPGRPIKDLCTSLGLSHSGTVRLVDRLEDRGWVRRERGGGGRQVRLTLTRPGERMFEELIEARRAALDEVLEPVCREDRERLAGVLTGLLSHLPSDRSDAWHICRLCEHRVCRGEDCPVGAAVESGRDAA